MKHLLRALTLAAVVGTALALTGSAFAAFTTPRLTVNKPTAGSRDDRVHADEGRRRPLPAADLRADSATRRRSTAAPGSTIGAVTAVVQANAISADAIVPLNGTIRVDSPTAATHNEPSRPRVPRRRGPITRSGCIVLQSPTGPLEVPVYVTAVTAAPESAFAAAKLVLCLPSPYIPQSAGGAALGAKVINAQMTIPASAHGPDGRRAVRLARDRDALDGRRRDAERAGTRELQAIDRARRRRSPPRGSCAAGT